MHITTKTKRYADLKLYEEIIFLKYNFKGGWAVENVIPFYVPLIPGIVLGRHMFWTGHKVRDGEFNSFPMKWHGPTGAKNNAERRNAFIKWLGLKLKYDELVKLPQANHDPEQFLRNCVPPRLGLHVISSYLKS